MEKDRQEAPPQETKRRYLLVAILIIAIIIIYIFIGAFFFGMSANDGALRTKSVAATARHVGNDIVVTWQGGHDNAQVTSYNITAWNETGGSSGTIVVPNTLVGNRTTVAGIGANGVQTHVVVVASFTDGSQQVVLNTYV